MIEVRLSIVIVHKDGKIDIIHKFYLATETKSQFCANRPKPQFYNCGSGLGELFEKYFQNFLDKSKISGKLTLTCFLKSSTIRAWRSRHFEQRISAKRSVLVFSAFPNKIE